MIVVIISKNKRKTKKQNKKQKIKNQIEKPIYQNFFLKNKLTALVNHLLFLAGVIF
jgi:hypothetical protein